MLKYVHKFFENQTSNIIVSLSSREKSISTMVTVKTGGTGNQDNNNDYIERSDHVHYTDPFSVHVIVTGFRVS